MTNAGTIAAANCLAFCCRINAYGRMRYRGLKFTSFAIFIMVVLIAVLAYSLVRL